MYEARTAALIAEIYSGTHVNERFNLLCNRFFATLSSFKNLFSVVTTQYV